MRITVDHPDADKAIIKLNDRPLMSWVSADNEEGWVEIVDLAAMVDMDLDNETDLDIDVDDEVEHAYDEQGNPVFEEGQGMEVQTKKRYGKIEIIIP